MKWVIEDEDDTSKGRIGHAGLATRALPHGRYPRERENRIITVGHTFCPLKLLTLTVSLLPPTIHAHLSIRHLLSWPRQLPLLSSTAAPPHWEHHC